MSAPWVEDISHAKTPLKFLVAVSKPYRWYALSALFFVTLSSGITALEPILYKYIVDAIAIVERGGSYHGVILWVGIYMAAMVIGMALWRTVNYLAAFWVLGVRVTARQSLTEYLFRHSHNYFENRFAGSTANKISHAADGVKNTAQDIVFGVWQFVVSMLVSLVVAFTANVSIGVVFVIWLAVAIPINYSFAKKRSGYSARAQAAETKLRGTAVDVVSNIRAVQEYARGFFEMGLMKNLILDRYDAGLKNWMFGQKVSFVNSGMQLFFVGIMLSAITYLAYLGRATPGSIVLVFALTTSVGERIFWLSNQIATLSENWGEIREGIEDILNEHEIPDVFGARPLEVTKGDIAFTDATFAYNEGEAVVQGFSLSIPPGQKVGLIGRSGAGKTTLVKLLLRHYELTGGSITIDGQNISEITQESLRDNVAVVPQEPLLFHRSIRENISYGKEEATDEEVVHAATLAEAHEFIEKLSQGYDTTVGERGVKLSGGQRQRVAIARALLKPAKVLILDEATSALDSESEAAIQQALRALMVGKTVIAIAHRLSTLREMDRLLVLDQGVIVEDGSHDELVAKNGVYASLWERQSGGYLKDE